ncbi:MAG: UDP-N-acetylglucosamine--N-acetylmuramyl-(pentapeptide) pyrophosphoryl-undecaprenol N-acetylglucosamine transferase, partial [Bacteroidetes bacterium]|nr:UDP-N-acetylglucosamine--N-acetylmuramyl-(pentapeptide) pyrophosphoryl-undecaprenol N-acetylglucosamine transferase [Bacteroidota bacterium]
GFQRRFTLKNISFPFKVIGSINKAKKIIREFQPDLVIGTGGYASGPVLRVAARKGIACVIQEQNSFAGVTNRILGKRVQKICVAWEGMEKFFPAEKIILTGNPVRSEVISITGKREKAAAHFGLNPDVPTILAVGGSLGARAINEGIAAITALVKEKGWQLVWQTGKLYADQASELLNNSDSKGIVTYPFITEMDLAYAMADVVISRAGAIAISELCCVEKPVILVPSPYVAEDHQTKNAMALVAKSAAVLVKDEEVHEKLGDAITHLMQNKELQNSLSTSIGKLAVADAATRIANEALKLIENV